MPKRKSDGFPILNKFGRVIHQRRRNYYESKALAEADKPRIREQNDNAGFGNFLFNRDAAADYEAANKLAGGVRMLEIAKFWRLHHPEKPKRKLAELFTVFLDELKVRNGGGRHYTDVKSRGTTFIKSGFGDRYPETATRQEILSYVRKLPNSSARGSDSRQASPRTMKNHKTAICIFFNWLVQDAHELQANPAAGIKNRMLPKDTVKEIEYLSFDQVVRYLRTLERYEPDLVAHEIVQLIAGVRADDEMVDFSASFVLPATKEIVIPAKIAKTENVKLSTDWRITSGLGGPPTRPKADYCAPKIMSLGGIAFVFFIRVLASQDDKLKAVELARLPIKYLLRLPASKAALSDWPWNNNALTKISNQLPNALSTFSRQVQALYIPRLSGCIADALWPWLPPCSRRE